MEIIKKKKIVLFLMKVIMSLQIVLTTVITYVTFNGFEYIFNHEYENTGKLILGIACVVVLLSCICENVITFIYNIQEFNDRKKELEKFS